MFKFIIPCALLAVANAGLLPQVLQPALHTQVIQHGAPLLQHAPQQVLQHSQVLVQQPQLIQRVAQPILHQQALVAHQPIAVAKQVEEYDPHPQYQFAYDIQDSLTGDSKNQQESRDGDVVHGSYSVNDPDGHRRTVEYTADPINGFNAVVSREPLVAKAIVAHAQPVHAAHTLIAH